MSPLTSHVLDTARGRPAQGMRLTIDRLEGDAWVPAARGETNADGRVPGLFTQETFVAATYRATFHTADWLRANDLPVFYPEVTVVFVVDAPHEHYHIPLLVSPYGYSTYRGS
ncbi:MAG: hydroxyisourate hydrolase [Myxococcales bacterium]|nr:hydroxyisourate hydrolase [Myxococcales bacterium]MCB9668138.1 hydroxyisourate hydrolase [Alphaproteobacteria bacterium]